MFTKFVLMKYFLFFFCKIEVEVVETVSDKEQDKWGPVTSEQVKKIDFFH